jgi:two-component sensor histidine kinase/ActR/RegA family two-component response regulator
MRQYIGRLLAGQGYQVEAVGDGEAALTSALHHRPDLIVSDVMMPGLDGVELTKRLRSDRRTTNVPILLLSARAGEEPKIEGLDSGADDYLVKPFSARALVARVASNIKLAALRNSYEQRISADLRNMSLLRELGDLCGRNASGFGQCVERIVDVAIEIANADKGILHLVNSESGELTIGAQRGFGKPFLDFFAHVRDCGAACTAAMNSGQRVVVQDVLTDQIFAGQESKEVLLEEGLRAVVSTPLVSSTGSTLGVLSVHFERPCVPGDPGMRFLDLLVIQAADYLERKRAEALERTLLREVQHRSGNILAVVQAIANRSLAGGELLDARTVFLERLNALARINRQLTATNWTGLALEQIVRMELEPFSARAIIDGANVVLRPQSAQNFCLALHELTTNAAKYGALSTTGGRVQVRWTTAGEGRDRKLTLRWQEMGGPKVSPPTRHGFGSTLLKATFQDVRLEYPSDGLICEIVVTFDSQ